MNFNQFGETWPTCENTTSVGGGEEGAWGCLDFGWDLAMESAHTEDDILGQGMIG